MATIPQKNMFHYGIGSADWNPFTYPEAAAQTFDRGALLYLVGGKLTACADAPTAGVGVAIDDATGVTDTPLQVIPLSGQLFVMNVYHAGGAESSVTAVTQVGSCYGLKLSSGKWYCDISNTTQLAVCVRALYPEDAVGDTYGRVIVEFLQGFDQIDPILFTATTMSGNITFSGANKAIFRAATEYVNSSGAGQLDIDAATEVEIATGTLDVNLSAAVSINSATASEIVVTGAGQDLSLSSVGGRVIIDGSEAAADALQLTASAGGCVMSVAAGYEFRYDGGAWDINIGAEQAIDINIADSTTPAAAGGAIAMTAGKGATTGTGGGFIMTAGQGGATGNGGVNQVHGGAGGATSGNGGLVEIFGGDATTDGDGGDVEIEGGDGAATNPGGSVFILGGGGGAGAGGNGGDVAIEGGAAGAGSGGDGGSILLVGGAGDGAGANGVLLARFGSYDTTGSAADHYVVTLPAALGYTAYAEGDFIMFKASHDNTGACDININGIGAASIKDNDMSDPAASRIKANSMMLIMYNGASFNLAS